MRIRRWWVVAVLGLGAGCSDDALVCEGGEVRGIRLTVLSTSGADLVNGTTITLFAARAGGTDSLEYPYRGNDTGVPSTGTAGQYRVRVRNGGYETKEELVNVPVSSTCEGLIVQHVTMILAPIGTAARR